MNHVELINQFITWEAKNELLSLKIRNRFFWDYLRYPVFDTLHRNLLGQDEIILPTKKNKSVIKQELLGLFKTFFTPKKRQKKCDILIINYDRKVLIDSKLVNPHFYPIIKMLSEKYNIQLADPSRYNTEVEKLYNCPVIRLRPYQYLARIRSKLNKFSDEEKSIYSNITKSIKDEFSTLIDIEEKAKLFFNYQVNLGKEYKKIFKKIAPKLILYSDNGSSKGWIDEAHSLGIKVYDYQHSLMSEANILYRYDNGNKIKILPCMPDTILTFGKFWDQYYQIPPPRVEIGFPYLEQKKSEFRLSKSQSKNNLVIISSMHSGKKLESLALELSKQLPHLQIYYKLRPEEYSSWKQVYSSEFQIKQNIHVIDSNSPTLYEVFSKCCFQIGVNSTALIEGFMFNLTTFILKDGWYQEMRPFYENNMFSLVETAQEIAEKITTNLKIDAEINPELLFQTNSIDNLVSKIDPIIKGDL